jgi:hypothetical protein
MIHFDMCFVKCLTKLVYFDSMRECGGREKKPPRHTNQTIYFDYKCLYKMSLNRKLTFFRLNMDIKKASLKFEGVNVGVGSTWPVTFVRVKIL